MGGGNGGLGGGSLGGGGLSKHQRYRYGLTVDSQFSGEAASQLSDEAHDTHSEHLDNGSPRGHRQQLDMPSDAVRCARRARTSAKTARCARRHVLADRDGITSSDGIPKARGTAPGRIPW